MSDRTSPPVAPLAAVLRDESRRLQQHAQTLASDGRPETGSADDHTLQDLQEQAAVLHRGIRATEHS